MTQEILITSRLHDKNGYHTYWACVDHIVRNAHDLHDVTEACLHQKLISEDIINHYTSQNYHLKAKEALYLDCVMIWRETRVKR